MDTGLFTSFPEAHYWFSGAAIFLPASFAITVFIGVVPIMNDKSRSFTIILLVGGAVLTFLGWHVAADQERKAADQEKRAALQENRLDAAYNDIRATRVQMADLLMSVNRSDKSASGVPSDLAILAPDMPSWVHAAYRELGQREIPGPRENPHIVDYFKTVNKKADYRDDLDDWASAFVEWSLNKSGIDGPKSDDPIDWLNWGVQLDKPQVGAVVVLSFSGLRHVGFFFGEDEDFVRVLGGNEDDAVNIFRYPKKSVLGYRMPPSPKQTKP